MKKKEKKTEERISVPKDVKVGIDKNTITFEGAGSTIKKGIGSIINFEVKEGEIILSAKKNKKEKKKIGTYKAHIKNIINGLKEPHKYTLKICSGHFPMNVSASNDELTVKNFLGEKIPRVLKLKKNVKVKVEGDEIIVESTDKELAGQTAADIEKLCKITNRDPRIFQDGIWIIGKSRKKPK